MSKVITAIRILIVFCAISSVLAFTLHQWLPLVNRYGNYGNYVESTDDADYWNLVKKFYLEYYYNYPTNTPSFETETIYREAIKYKYDLAFRKIWTFGAFVFASSFLLLMVIKPKKVD